MQLSLTPEELTFLKQLFESDIAITVKTAKIVGPLQLKIEALAQTPSTEPPEGGTL